MSRKRDVAQGAPVGRRKALQAASATVVGAGLYGSLDSVARPFEVDFENDKEPAFQRIVSELIDSPRDKIFETCTELLRIHSSDTVLATILSADVRVIAPDSGGDLHAALAIHASRHLSQSLPPRLRLVPIYHAANALKFRQSRQVNGPLIGKAEAPNAVSEAAARAGFDAAMAAWDPEEADRAVVDLFENLPTQEAAEQIMRWGARETGNIGHGVIWFALGIQSLDALGWQFAQPVLRSMARDMVGSKTSGMADYYQRHRAELSAVARLHLDDRRTDDGVTRELVAEVRRGNTGSASRLVLNLIKAGAPIQSLWDGFALAGCEHLLRLGAGFALHRFDGMNALHHLYSRAKDPLTKATTLVQTAAFMASFELPQAGIDIFELQRRDVRRPDEVFRSIDKDPGQAASSVLGWLAGGGSQDVLQRRAEELTVLKAHRVDEHNYKFPVAVIEETQRASPQWKPYVFAAIGGQAGRCPSTQRDDWIHLREVRQWIAKLA